MNPLKLPINVPKLGFWRHYKHEPAGPTNNYTYEVVGIGVNTEDDCPHEHRITVLYRPLYNSELVEASKKSGNNFHWSRPLDNWMGDVDKGDYKGPRFIPVTDSGTITDLHWLSQRMYP